MKKSVSVFLALLLLVCLCAAGVSAADEVSIVGITFASEGGVCEEAYQGGADVKCLYDGETLPDTKAFNTAGVLLVKNKQASATEAVVPTCTFTLELSEKASVSAVDISILHQVQAMVGVPVSVKVEYSADDETYYDAGTFPIDTTADVDSGNFVGAKVEDVRIDVSDYKISAKYIMLTFTYGDIPAYNGNADYWTSTAYKYTSLEWIGFTEFGVETAAAVEESSAAPVESSAAPVESSTAGGSSSTPATGDTGLAAVAVIALAALCGAAVVLKKRS